MPYDNTNSGLLTVNDSKKSPSHPDYRGSINVGGVDYWLSGWKKIGKSGKLVGKTFLSLSIEPKEKPRQQQSTPPPAQKAPPAAQDDGEDVPF